MWVHDLVDADAAGARCGGKAAGLAKLVRAGLPVPEGFAIDAAAFEALVGDGGVLGIDDIGHRLEAAAQRIDAAHLPPAFVAAVEARAAALGDRLVVRSSATIEDGALGAAPGVFRSVAIDDRGQLWPAIRSVWTSALTPLAVAYARTIDASRIAIGVVVQRRVDGERTTVYTRSASDPDAAIIQRAGTTPRPRSATDPTLALALRAEVAIAASAPGADVELVGDHVVQARPIAARPSTKRVAPPPMILAALRADGRTWTWDVSHNPAPLSAAQQELVERVERAGVAPWAMRVAGGYLYTTPLRRIAIEAPATVDDLRARVAAIELRLAAILDEAARDPHERYLAFYAIWANELSPLVAAAARRVPRAVLLAHRPHRAPELARIAHHAPAWDVAVPTYGERPELVAAALAAWRSIPSPPITDPYAALVAELAELDDDWFYRAQWMIRRDVVLPALADRSIEATRRRAAERAARDRAASWRMPLAIPEPPATDAASLHGTGIGPRVVGRVVRLTDRLVPPGSVVVVQSVTPGLALLVAGAVALVGESSHDGVLDHGVALARELAITCVVGCRDAWSLLEDGMLVEVDGDRGAVTRVGEAS